MTLVTLLKIGAALIIAYYGLGLLVTILIVVAALALLAVSR